MLHSKTTECTRERLSSHSSRDFWLRCWKDRSSGICSKLHASRVTILEFLAKISCSSHENSRVIPASSTQNPCEFGGFVAWKKWNIHAGHLKIRSFPTIVLYNNMSLMSLLHFLRDSHFKSLQNLMRLYRTFGLLVFQILPDRKLLYWTESVWLNEWLKLFGVLYESLHKVWMVKEQNYVQAEPFSISHCILDAKFWRTFALVIFDFLPDRHSFYRSGPMVLRCFRKTAILSVRECQSCSQFQGYSFLLQCSLQEGSKFPLHVWRAENTTFMRDICRIHAWSTQLFPQHKGIGSSTCEIFRSLQVNAANFMHPGSSMQNPCKFGGFVAWKKWNIHAGQLKIRIFPQAVL